MQLLTLLSLCLAAMLQCTAVLAQSCPAGTIPVVDGTTCEPCGVVRPLVAPYPALVHALT